MAASHLEVTWDAYQNSICQGLSRLQNNQEFVDMTLAADGYLVKTHQNIIALSSPYIKSMLMSADCQHPVIFLNNVTYQVLTYILEYIYMGKVQVPGNVLESFVTACKALKITGLQDIPPCVSNLDTKNPKNANTQRKPPDIQEPQWLELTPHLYQENNKITNNTDTFVCPGNTDSSTMNQSTMNTSDPAQPSTNNFAAVITISQDNYNLDIQKLTGDANNYDNTEWNGDYVNQEHRIEDMDMQQDNDFNSLIVINNSNDKEVLSSTNLQNAEFAEDFTLESSSQSEAINISEKSEQVGFKLKDIELKPHYTISNRGALQLVFNRFMYSCHQTTRGRKKRWRCLDYRKSNCRAAIDTEGENIIARTGIHDHPFHDQKILKKISSGVIFASIKKAQSKKD